MRRARGLDEEYPCKISHVDVNTMAEAKRKTKMTPPTAQNAASSAPHGTKEASWVVWNIKSLAHPGGHSNVVVSMLPNGARSRPRDLHDGGFSAKTS